MQNRARAPWLLLPLLAACFVEPGGGSEGDACTAALGCACGAGGACEAGLVCAAGAEVCIADGCDPGSALCTCSDGLCLQGLACVDEICRAADGGSDGSGSHGGGAGTGSASEDVGTASGGDATSSGSVSASVSDSASGTASSGTSASDSAADTAGPGGDGPACHACLAMATRSGACDMEFAGCAANSACVDLGSCVGSCLDQDDAACIAGCCGMNPAGVAPYDALASCQFGLCTMECDGFALACG
ncbi:MAG: hypothetical protein K1X88_02925 [Nannocystaceae bacterium]|nr:hypothetical protein [Nannocystaceae bacterium]